MRRSRRKKVYTTPIVIGATGAVPAATKRNVDSLGCGIRLRWLQKIAAFETVKITKEAMSRRQ